MAMERPPYTRLEADHDHDTPPASALGLAAPPPRTLRHKVSRVLTTLTRRDPTSPERERGPSPPMPTPCTAAPLSPTTSTSTTSTAVEHEHENPPLRAKRSQNALKRTWGRGVAMARTRSEPALRAKRAKAAAAALLPAVPSRSAPATTTTTTTTTHSRDVNAYVPDRGEGAVVSYTYPLWRVDPVLVGCFVCL